MIPAEAAKIIEGWARNAKTAESRAACAAALAALRSDMPERMRAIVATSGAAHVALELIPSPAGETWVAWLHKGPTTSAPTPEEALDAIAEKLAKEPAQ